MPLSSADVQILPPISTHIHLRRKASAASAPSRIMIGPAPMGIQIFRTLSFRRMGLEVAALLNFSQLFFVSRIIHCSGGMYISYSLVSKKREDFNSCQVCRLFSGLAKKYVSSFFLCVLTRVPQASSFSYDTPMDSVINRHLLQLNVISSQTTESNTVSEKNTSTAQFPRIERHEETWARSTTTVLTW
jgi:hypothetical protein